MNQSDKYGINQAEKFISEFPLSFVGFFWEGGESSFINLSQYVIRTSFFLTESCFSASFLK